MSRASPALLAASVASLAMSLMGGDVRLVLVFLLPTVVLAAWTRSARADVAESHWTAPTGAGTGAGRPSCAGWPSSRRTALTLARVEARELALSPWFGIGLGLCLTMVVSFAPGYEDESFVEIVDDLPFFAHALVGMVVVASHRAVTRSQRDDARELFDSCATAPSTRTWGALATAWVPVAVLSPFFAAFMSVVDGALADPAPQLTPGQSWAHFAWISAITAVTAAVAVARIPARGRG